MSYKCYLLVGTCASRGVLTEFAYELDIVLYVLYICLKFIFYIYIFIFLSHRTVKLEFYAVIYGYYGYFT